MIFDQIQLDSTHALKTGDKDTLITLRGLIAAIKYKEIDLKRSITDDDCLDVLRKQISQLKDGVSQFTKGGRGDLVDEYELQIKILSKYLPPELTDKELEIEVKLIISQNETIRETKPQALLGIVIGKLKNKASSEKILSITKSILGI